MSKKQKIFLAIFVSMFALPEILWSPVYKFYINWSKPTVKGHYQIVRKNFLDNYGNSDIWSNIILFQFFGLLLATIYLIVLRKHFQNKIVVWLLISLLFLATVFVFIVHGFSTIRITF